MSLPGGTDFDISCSLGTMCVSVLWYYTATGAETWVNSLDLVRAPDAYVGNTEDLRDVQSINAAVKATYENVQHMLQNIVYLKRYKNSLGGYGSLPSEILLEIFRWCPKKRETAKDPCYAFSQVCHRWRSASIADKTLWTTPDLLHPYLATEMYKHRTADLPLHIHFPDLFWAIQDRNGVFEFPSGISERARSIDLSYSRLGTDEDPCAEPESAIDDFFRVSKCFPMLESLSLRSGDEYSQDTFYMCKDAPMLRSVTLEDCLFRWNSYVYNNLTSLTIVLNHGVYFSSRYTERNQRPVLELLRRNPNLETLVLKDVMCRGGLVKLVSPTSNDITPVEFAHMKSLTLSDNIDNIAPLVRLLKVPFASKVEIRADLTQGPESLTRTLLEKLGRALVKFLKLNGWTTKYRDIMILIDYKGSYVWLRERHGCGDMFKFSVSRPSKYYMDPARAWSEVLSTILLTGTPYINHAQCWRGKEARHTPMDYLCAGLAKLSALRTLEVFDQNSKPQIVEDLLTTLDPRTLDDSNAPQTFPALKALYVKEIEMFKEASESQRESVFQKLESVLERRKTAGENIPEVIWLKECSFIEPLEVVLAASKNGITTRNPRIIETLE